MSRTFAMTGGATGIGAALKNSLQVRGDQVIVVDIKDADIIADLSTAAGRKAAIDGIRNMATDGLDGFIPCAGLGPNVMPHSLIVQVNYFSAIAMIEGVKDLLVAKKGVIVVVASNSTTLPGLNETHLQLLKEGDEAKTCDFINSLDGHNAYAGSKRALAEWMRCKSPDYMKAGIRMNAVAPGMTRTPMTDKVLNDAIYGQAMRDFSQSIPYGEMATPDMIADTMLFLLDPASRFVCGSVLFVDGGQDALLRPNQF